MKLDIVKNIVKTKKGKAAIIAIISGGILHFFPGSADVIAQIANILAEILTGVADNVEPIIE